MVYFSKVAFPKGKCCNFCKTKIIDPISLGNVYESGDLVVHYFCLLLASKGVQRGTDRQGLLGFLPKDIKDELKRGSKIKCNYCRKKGATVICANNKCKINFHLPCGLKKNSLHFFCRDFRSFCVEHRSKTIFPSSLTNSIAENQTVCILCFTSVNVKDIYNLIWPPCCKPSSLQHKNCVQKMAYAAGYYFKCPFCADSKTFNKVMKKSGIYIPEQEASWEREPRAFSDLNLQLKCHAVFCSCPKGASYSRNGSKWHLETCILCGANATHLACLDIWKPGMFSIDWQCPDCTSLILRQVESRRDIIYSSNLGLTETNSSATYKTANEDFQNFSSVQEKNDNRITVGLNYLEGKEKVFYPRQDIASCGNQRDVLFVNETSLNSALKNVSNIVEIIINNKRCMVSLNQLDFDSGNHSLKINDNDLKSNINHITYQTKFASIHKDISKR